MESLAEKCKERDVSSSSDFLTDSMSESRNGSTNSSKSCSDASFSFDESKARAASSPATKGWPLPKPPLPTKCFKIDEEIPKCKDDERTKLRKLGSKVSGLSLGFFLKVPFYFQEKSTNYFGNVTGFLFF